MGPDGCLQALVHWHDGEAKAAFLSTASTGQRSPAPTLRAVLGQLPWCFLVVPTKPSLEQRAPLSGPQRSPSLPSTRQGPSVAW